MPSLHLEVCNLNKKILTTWILKLATIVHTTRKWFVINSDNLATIDNKLQKLGTIRSHHKSDVPYLHHQGFIVLLDNRQAVEQLTTFSQTVVLSPFLVSDNDSYLTS